jgi:plasmid stabilization system protein ParE
MAARVKWSPEALDDIEQIATYIEQDSAWYARAVARKLFEAADSL